MRLGRVWAWLRAGAATSAFGFAGCGGGAGESEPGQVSQPQERDCGDPSTSFYGGVCAANDFCVETRGAACQPLPAPGEQCPAGCTLTEHCCNCPAFGCLTAPEEGCEGTPQCGCVETIEAFAANCPPDRRECTEGPNGVELVCIAVAFDEDPFADAGAN